MAKNKRWMPEEEDILLRQVEAFPHKLSRCFMIVAEQIDRSPKAVASHWYNSLSKRPGSRTAFGLLTSTSFSKNRKNGEGVPHSSSLFRRIIRMLGFD